MTRAARAAPLDRTSPFPTLFIRYLLSVSLSIPIPAELIVPTPPAPLAREGGRAGVRTERARLPPQGDRADGLRGAFRCSVTQPVALSRRPPILRVVASRRAAPSALGAVVDDDDDDDNRFDARVMCLTEDAAAASPRCSRYSASVAFVLVPLTDGRTHSGPK